jgi:hypothetical protein
MFSLENLQKTLKFYYNMTFSRLQEKCPTDDAVAKQHFGRQGRLPMRYQLVQKSTLMTNARQPTTRSINI